jgi:hypothetical protein
MNTAVITAMDAVEIKVTIGSDQELRAERTMEVDENKADVRLLYFYDTRDLDLFKSGVVLRARLVKGGADDSTVKIRPVEAADVARVAAHERIQIGSRLGWRPCDLLRAAN